MTKSVWQYGRTGGQYIGEWKDDVTLQVPYTDEPPLEGEFPDGSKITIDDLMIKYLYHLKIVGN